MLLACLKLEILSDRYKTKGKLQTFSLADMAPQGLHNSEALVVSFMFARTFSITTDSELLLLNMIINISFKPTHSKAETKRFLACFTCIPAIVSKVVISRRHRGNRSRKDSQVDSMNVKRSLSQTSYNASPFFLVVSSKT